MVRGLEKFRDYFEDYKEQYILIGGSACYLFVDAQGGSFRATRDLDLVLCAEALTKDFARKFWDFVKEGGYRTKKKADGKQQFYRFDEPKDESFPEMLELLSRTPGALEENAPGGIIRMTVEEEFISLSAILLNKEYYDFLHDNKKEISGVPCAGVECLIPLKIRAWLDLKEKKSNGENIRSRDVKKHRNDVLRLEDLLPNIKVENVPDSVKDDLILFKKEIVEETNILENLSIDDRTLEDITDHFDYVYGVEIAFSL